MRISIDQHEMQFRGQETNRPHISSPMHHVLAQHVATVSRSAQLSHRPVVAYTKTRDDQQKQDK